MEQRESSPLRVLRATLALDDIRPNWTAENLPTCSERCPSFDGKRCEKLGRRPEFICEPTVLALARAVLGNA